MEQPINFSLSNNATSIQLTQNIESKYKKSKCNECNKRRKKLDKGHKVCHVCYKIKIVYKYGSSGIDIIDKFIRKTQVKLVNGIGKMEFVPYGQFEDIKFIAEGGFSKIYKATWIDGPVINYHNKKNIRNKNCTIVLKKINGSKNITSKELNELQIFYDFSSKHRNGSNSYICNNVGKYYGITQDPDSQDIVIIMPYYDSGDLIYYITKDFYNINWKIKLGNLESIALGLVQIHEAEIIHRDFHSGNIFFNKQKHNFETPLIGDLGISKSATESGVDNENYGIIPFMAPEIFQGQKYGKASDIYGFGMIMWELMTGRRPFWDRNHDTELIIDICDGLRPPIVTNAPEDYVELMKECWNSDPEKRPIATDLHKKINIMVQKESKNHDNNSPTEIIKSSDIGPVTINNPGAIYKSRPLSAMINSAMSLRSSRNQSINLQKVKSQIIRRKELNENEDTLDYLTKELEFE
ncbi:hypothetical protein RclHR1_06010003 [Rhizophagus clarus]|nr:hypothetical protein RclHR1_06010003 [Rhizophagus clarus]